MAQYSQSIFHLVCDQSFWQTLSGKKLNEWKLEEPLYDVYAKFTPGEFMKNRNILQFDSFSLNYLNQQQTGKLETHLVGKVKVFNKIEDFDVCKFGDLNEQLLQSQSVKFYLMVYINLKTHYFKYKFCMVQLNVEMNQLILNSECLSEKEEQEQTEIKKVIESLMNQQQCLMQTNHIEIKDGEYAISGSNSQTVLMFDAQKKKDNFNMSILTELRNQCPQQQKVRAIIIKDEIIIGQPIKFVNSQLLDIDLSKLEETTIKENYGQIKQLDMKEFMDQNIIAQNAVNLNIKLMKWRIVPDLKVDELQDIKCLLLGAGTLGCQLARNLLGWGIRNIDFIDNGRISFSNPVRQSLYLFEDSVNNLPKAETAAKRLKSIHPVVDSTGYVMNIPMPGHYQKYKDWQEMLDEADKLEQLIKQHDVIYLLTDNRESRWLATVIGQIHQKVVISVALGFDNYVVVRHGVNGSDCQDKNGCYFCNDIVVPQDSMSDRTLDQQCTVTRPGVSFMASALASEVLVSLFNHQQKKYAPIQNDPDVPVEQQEGMLGFVPQYIRGNLYDYQQSILCSKNYKNCVACSEMICQEYSNNRDAFLVEVIKNPDYLHTVSGIEQQLAKIDFDKDFIAID